MYKEIDIAGDLIPMAANATTPIRYRQVFSDDFYDNFSTDKLVGSHFVEFAGKVAYIMMSAAAKRDMSTLSYDDYWQWLESLPASAIALAASNIIELYNSNERTVVEPKKKRNEPKDDSQ